MRVVFCGSGAFAVPSLQAIAAAPAHEIVGVVTQPARPAGRGGRLAHTPVAQAAATLGLPVAEVEKINAPDSLATLAAMRGDVMCVADFGQFIRLPARELFPHRAFNLHGSVLPELRGAAPVNWAIIRGYRRTGVTTFDLVDKMDAGPMYLTAETDIAPAERADELRSRLAQIGAELVVRTLDSLAAGALAGRVQDESRATPAPKLTKADGLIDWSADAASIAGRINGTWPWPACHVLFSGQHHSEAPVALARAEALAAPPAQLGVLVSGATPDGRSELTVGTGNGRLRVLELQPAGKRLIAWKDFVNGYRVAEGDRFIAPPAPQENS